MSYIITIRTAAGERTYPASGDLAALLANISDDVPMGVTVMVQP